MKLQKTTWVLLIVALLLGGFVYFYEIVGAPQREAAQEAEKQLFGFEEDEIQQVNIYIQEESRKFERVSDSESGSDWQMTEPKEVTASDPSVAFLLNLLVEGKSDRVIANVSPDNLKEYGLDQPQAMVTVQLKNSETHEILLGQPDFNNSFLYAQVDSFSDKSQKSNVFLVPVDFEYAVNRPLSEWEQSQEDTSEEIEPSETENEESAPENPAQPTPNNSDADNSDAETEESTPEPTPTSENKTPSASPSPENAEPSEEKQQSTEENNSSVSEETNPKTTPNEAENDTESESPE